MEVRSWKMIDGMGRGLPPIASSFLRLGVFALKVYFDGGGGGAK